MKSKFQALVGMSLVLALLFSFCKQPGKTDKTLPASPEKNTEITSLESPSTNTSEGGAMSTNEEETTNEVPTPSEVPTIPPKEITVAPNSDPKLAKPQFELCGGNNFRLIEHLNNQAQDFKAQKIPYSQANGTDCSGMFHKMLNTFKGNCPKVDFPEFAVDRSSRGIAKWYDNNDNLVIIRDPQKSAHLIKPGTVMFFGHGKLMNSYDRAKMTIDDLAAGGTGINHVAIVISVVEKNGVVESYEMFHGLNPGKTADITTGYLEYPQHPELPAYSNWKEPWLAISNILTPKAKAEILTQNY